MSANSKKLIVNVSLFLGILLCILGCIAIKPSIKSIEKGLFHPGNLPIRRLQITIDVDRREELFVQLREFAEKHSFRILIREVEVIPEGIFIEMYRDDIEISAADVPNAPTMINLGFYEANPANPTSEETVDELFSDLKSFLSEIPNISVTEVE
jgi:hypothetical protein